MAKSKHKHRRQLPENFEIGDCTCLQLNLQGCLIVSEQNENGDWLLTLQITGITSERLEYSSGDNGLAPTTKLIPVLWATRGDELEVVVEVGARQRLQALGLSARQKEALRSNLASLPAGEAANLLKEFVEIKQKPVSSTGHLVNKNVEK
ncbi:hypothetical protein [Bythopirellula goksoeyrii]|uniref:Uncharacterized protein n=1 Tax=Bythopirellula goksoeyrii TaxID=1400387 RepID=A0A5B9QQI3_9BACT|nr:hypothetical protein [Bythopirellula goksoeyrii]QEG36223.1 hypothetical protein Pr1d_35350 [Bythopirellula goksoeyrii]